MAENRANEGGSPPRDAVATFDPDQVPSDTLGTIYLMTIAILGITVIASLVGAIWLTLAGQEIPDLLVSLGSAAIGALAGLLAPSAGD